MAKKKHEEAHGGAWKVAYADFVTAMMALFMVLWISAQQDEILIATSKYFQNPFSSPLPASSGVMEGKKEKVENDDQAQLPTRMFTHEMYTQIAKEFLKLMDIPPEQKEKPVEVKVTSDGIVISVFNRNKQPIFDGTSTQFTPWGEFVCQNLAWTIDRFHMGVRIDSHVPQGLVTSADKTTPWNLTALQSDAMRANLVRYGLDASKVDRITGYADTRPLDKDNPTDVGNYRVELTLSATSQTPASRKRTP